MEIFTASQIVHRFRTAVWYLRLTQYTLTVTSILWIHPHCSVGLIPTLWNNRKRIKVDDMLQEHNFFFSHIKMGTIRFNPISVILAGLNETSINNVDAFQLICKQ